MTADLVLQKAIFTHLAEDAGLIALVGARIHDNAPGDAVFPFLVLGENDTRNWPGGMEHRLALHCFSRSGGRMEAKSILGAVHVALDDKSLTLEGHTLINLRFLDSTTRREADGTTWRGTIRFRAITENGESV